MDFKNTRRKEIKEYITTLGEKKRQEYSNRIYKHLLESQIYKEASRLFIYISFGEEVITDRIVEKALLNGKEVFVPVIDKKEMGFYKIEDLKNLKKNRYGIREPEPITEGNPENRDLIVVPGLSFTKDGKRLGRGGGYYDRFFTRYRDCIKLGICFSCQLSLDLTLDSWDIRMDYIITEENIYGGN